MLLPAALKRPAVIHLAGEPVNPVRLRFCRPEVEAAFQVDYFRNSIGQFRIAVFTGFFLLALFGLLDAQVIPDPGNLQLLRVVRYGLLCPLVLSVFLASFVRSFRPLWQTAGTILTIAVGTGLVFVGVLCGPEMRATYQAALLLVLFYSPFLRLGFWATFRAGFCLLGIYWLVTGAFPESLSPEVLAAFSCNYVAANLISTFAMYQTEFYARKEFANRLSVGQFFSPSLRASLVRFGLHEVLHPRLLSVTVLFFDLRGFSGATQGAHTSGSLMEFQEDLTSVMSLVADEVFAEEGVVIDYQGDALLACFGAPRPQFDHQSRGLRVATRVLERLCGEQSFRAGIALDSGTVVAGQVGARSQLKYGLVGEVVNRASRLQELTKLLGLPLLVTGPVREGSVRLFRALGKAALRGMAGEVELFEPVLPLELGGSGFTPVQVGFYESALAALRAGRPLEALKYLDRLPTRDEPARRLTRIAHSLRRGEILRWDGRFLD